MHPRAARLFSAWISASFGVVVCAFYVSTLRLGVWEDGYFVLRFAYNFWHHGVFAWNPSDGPIYSMTSQLLQGLGTLLYALEPHHMVLTLKAALCLALFATLPVLGRIARDDRAESAWGLLPAAVALSLPLVLEVIGSGLETVLAMMVVALALRAVLRWQRGQAGAWPVAMMLWLTYLTRPDAVLIPATLLVLLAWPDLRRLVQVAAISAAGFALLLFGFQRYYGTALPIAFYVKTHGITAQPGSLLAIYAAEKIKNAAQAAFFALPFVYVALHERTRLHVALLASGASFAAYHYVATIEVMGHFSRFYLPALVPIALAAALAYPAFLRVRRVGRNALAFAGYLLVFAVLQHIDASTRLALMIDAWRFFPFLFGCAVMLFTPSERPLLAASLVSAALWALALAGYPVHELAFEDDTTILLRQIEPRLVFRGLALARERLEVRTLFHTDMGAPGVLFPETRVVDLDGLLNKDITLRHARFDDLCLADRPDVLFVPKKAYAELKREVLASRCIEGYRSVDAGPKSPMRVRADLVPRWNARAGR
jgi:hypothetical protein